MERCVILIATLLLVLGLAAPSPAQRVVKDRLCPKCDSTGRIPNEIKKRELAQLESEVKRCSWNISRDRTGRGLPFLPCARCLAPSKAAKVQEEFDALAAEEDKWMAECTAIDKHLKPRRPLIHIETEHFRLVCGLPKVNLSKTLVLDAHEAAHLYARRLEEFYGWYQELIGYTDQEARVLTHQVFLMGDLRTLMMVADDYVMSPTDRSTRAVGDPSMYATWYDKSVFNGDAGFHRHVLLGVSHLFLGVYYTKIWLVERAGWLEEGLANVCEMRRFQLSGNSCNQEQAEEDLEDGDWEPLVKKLVLSGKTISFADLKDKRADVLSGREHLFAWSFTDFLIARDKSKLPEFIRRLKTDVDVRDCLRDLYGLTVLGFDEVWAEWVKENYRLKPLGG